MQEPTLRVTNLVKHFGDLHVLKGVSLSVDRGEVKVVLGPSGSGKSTLLRCINRLSPADGGEVAVDGAIMTHENENAMRSRIGFVFQDFALFAHLTALDNVALGLRRVKGMTRAAAHERARQELDRVGLSDRALFYPAQLSGGQQQRVGIARALAMDPAIILFDEPTSALDPELTAEVLSVMRKIAELGITMMVVTHEMGFAREVASQVVFMDQGSVIEVGSPENFFTNPQSDRSRRFLAAMRS
jgi:polar amino acid transport system ATP-binding protein